jgi:hypothetical protein
MICRIVLVVDLFYTLVPLIYSYGYLPWFEQIGPSYPGHQPVIYPQVAPTPQQYFHANGPQVRQCL